MQLDKSMLVRENLVTVVHDVVTHYQNELVDGKIVDADMVLQYLTEFSTVPDGTDRIAHFALWLKQELPLVQQPN